MTVAAGTISCSSSTQLCGQRGHAREVAAWSVQAGDDTKLDRITGEPEHDRNGRGRRLGSEYCREASDRNHSDVALDQIGRERG
jgi:hypothetical protein